VGAAKSCSCGNRGGGGSCRTWLERTILERFGTATKYPRTMIIWALYSTKCMLPPESYDNIVSDIVIVSGKSDASRLELSRFASIVHVSMGYLTFLDAIKILHLHRFLLTPSFSAHFELCTFSEGGTFFSFLHACQEMINALSNWQRCGRERGRFGRE
jgi:hypothetical protein